MGFHWISENSLEKLCENGTYTYNLEATVKISSTQNEDINNIYNHLYPTEDILESRGKHLRTYLLRFLWINDSDKACRAENNLPLTKPKNRF